MDPQRRPINSKTYAATGALNLVADGGVNQPAERIIVTGAGTLAVTKGDGTSDTMTALAGSIFEGSFAAITGGTATNFTVTWYR